MLCGSLKMSSSLATVAVCVCALMRVDNCPDMPKIAYVNSNHPTLTVHVRGVPTKARAVHQAIKIGNMPWQYSILIANKHRNDPDIYAHEFTHHVQLRVRKLHTLTSNTRSNDMLEQEAYRIGYACRMRD
jgi:hypothetical protein